MVQWLIFRKVSVLLMTLFLTEGVTVRNWTSEDGRVELLVIRPFLAHLRVFFSQFIVYPLFRHPRIGKINILSSGRYVTFEKVT